MYTKIKIQNLIQMYIPQMSISFVVKNAGWALVYFNYIYAFKTFLLNQRNI